MFRVRSYHAGLTHICSYGTLSPLVSDAAIAHPGRTPTAHEAASAPLYE